MKKTVLLICAAVCAAAMPVMAAPVTVPVTTLTKTIIENQKTIKQKTVELPAKKNGKAGEATLKFTVPEEGWTMLKVYVPRGSRPTTKCVYGYVIQDNSLTDSKWEKGEGMTTPVSNSTGSTKSAEYEKTEKNVKMSVTKDAAGKSFLIKNRTLLNGEIATYEKYLKKGTYYVRLKNVNAKKVKVTAAVGFRSHQSKAVTLKRNKAEFGACKDGKSFTTYKISVPKKQKVTINLFAINGKVVLTGNGISKSKAAMPVVTDLLSGGWNSSHGFNANNNAKPLVVTLKKGTYTVKAYGKGIHRIIWN